MRTLMTAERTLARAGLCMCLGVIALFTPEAACGFASGTTILSLGAQTSALASGNQLRDDYGWSDDAIMDTFTPGPFQLLYDDAAESVLGPSSARTTTGVMSNLSATRTAIWMTATGETAAGTEPGSFAYVESVASGMSRVRVGTAGAQAVILRLTVNADPGTINDATVFFEGPGTLHDREIVYDGSGSFHQEITLGFDAAADDRFDIIFGFNAELEPGEEPGAFSVELFAEMISIPVPGTLALAPGLLVLGTRRRR